MRKWPFLADVDLACLCCLVGRLVGWSFEIRKQVWNEVRSRDGDGMGMGWGGDERD
jgi:hypothetical protein